MFNGTGVWVRRAETGDLRGYAEQKQEICVGTQSRNTRSAWVRRAETGALRRYAEQKKVLVCMYSKSTWRDSVSGCVPAVTVRSAVEEPVHGHAVRQKGLCGYTQGSRR